MSLLNNDQSIERVLNDVWDDDRNFLRTGTGGVSVTPTIVNVSTTTGAWTLVASGLSDIFSWRLSERGGNDFRYAFVAAPTAYATGFGWVSDNTPLTAIYVQRPTATNVNMELIHWS